MWIFLLCKLAKKVEIIQIYNLKLILFFLEYIKCKNLFTLGKMNNHNFQVHGYLFW